MTDVELGGGTAFINVGALVEPRKVLISSVSLIWTYKESNFLLQEKTEVPGDNLWCFITTVVGSILVSKARILQESNP